MKQQEEAVTVDVSSKKLDLKVKRLSKVRTSVRTGNGYSVAAGGSSSDTASASSR